MAKKSVKKTTRVFVADEVELRRWCIEQAVRWPVHSESGYGGQMVGGYANAKIAVHRDEDVIGRADKIHDWVTTAA